MGLPAAVERMDVFKAASVASRHIDGATMPALGRWRRMKFPLIILISGVGAANISLAGIRRLVLWP